MEACRRLGNDEETITRIIGGHNVQEVDEIAVVYQRNFSGDMRGVSHYLLILYHYIINFIILIILKLLFHKAFKN